MDIRALLHNKWALAGVAAAAGLGLYVLIKHRNAGAGSAAGGSSTVAAAPGYTATGVGGFDSTGTDVAAYIGQEQGFLQNQFTEFNQNLQDQLAKIPTQGSTGSTGSGPAAAPPPTPKYRSTGNRSQSFATAAQLSGISTPALLALNPQLTKASSIGPHTTFRVG